MDYARNPSPICAPIQGRSAASSRPLKPYNRSHMQPALRSSIPDASLAVFSVNGGKPHQGLASKNPAPNQGHEVCNFTVLLGLQSAAVLNRIGSRSPGKERDTESGNDYFGARYYASSMGRMMSPDPHSGTLLHIFNPQRWNMYAYALNNPLTFVDPTGMDAVAVNFSGMVGGLGHEGILAISSNGSATYSRFGPAEQSAGGGWGLDEPGQADVHPLNVTVQFGSDGLPTADSYKALEGAVAGIEKAPASTVRLNYFKTSDAETAALKEWMKQQHDAAGKYELCTRNCANFTVQGLLAGQAINQSQASKLSNHPNTLFGQLVPLAADSSPHYKVTSRIVPDSIKPVDQQ